MPTVDGSSIASGLIGVLGVIFIMEYIYYIDTAILPNPKLVDEVEIIVEKLQRYLEVPIQF
jgi:hypothetical protein